jgi:ComEC/Rec2-related protein
VSSGSFLPLRQRFPFAGILIAAIAGILLTEWLGDSRWIATILLLSWLILLPLRRQGSHCWVLTAACFALLQLWNWQEAPARRLASLLGDGKRDYEVQGIIDGEPRVSFYGSCTFPLRLQSIEKVGAGNELEFACHAPVRVEVRWTGAVPLYGDQVRLTATACRPPAPRNPGAMDYRRWLERHGIYTEFRLDPSVPGTVLSYGHGNPLMDLSIRVRQRMEKILAIDLPGTPEVLGVIRGITLGVTEHTPEGFKDDFRFTGTMHLFAVSGLHVGMLAVIIWFTLRAIRLPQGFAIAITIPALFFYVLVTGMKMGSIRSAVMASILLVGLAIYRRAPLINTLAAAAALQLACDPNALFSAGWQFSYSVVFAILLLGAPLQAWVESLYARDPFLPAQLLTAAERFSFGAWRHFSGLAAVSAAAWVGALIPTLIYFHLVSLSAFGANLLAVPLAFGVLSLGAISLLTGTFFPWIAGAFNNTNWLLAKLLLLVVQANALLPGGHWFVGTPAPPTPVMTLLDLHGGSCAVVRDGGEFVLIDAGRKRDAYGEILPYLESLGANALQSCLVTKSDASHLGGLPMVRKEIPVLKILATSSSSHSVVAKKIFSSLKLTPFLEGMSTGLTKRVTAELIASNAEKFSAIRITLGESPVLILSTADHDLISSLSGMSDKTLHAEILVLPLGGAEMVSMMDLVARISPKAVITSVDPFKRNGIPSQEWDQLLAGKGIALFRQDECGAVTIKSRTSASGSRSLIVEPFVAKSEAIHVRKESPGMPGSP